MKITRDLIEKLITDYEGTDISGYLAEELSKMEAVRSAIRHLYDRQQEATQRLESARAEISREFSQVRENCGHWQTTTYPDSGGSGELTVCDFCDKIIR